MADISKIKVPDGTSYNIKDNSQTRSNHNHYDSDTVPLVHKKYESTSYYATSAGSWETSSWYFMSVKPDSWYKPWRIKFKVHSYCPNYANVESYTWTEFTGRADAIAYCNWNERYDAAHYYIPYYPLKNAGYNAGYGHAIGISILYGTGYTNSAYYRTFEVDYYECENCTVTFLDTPVKWANWTGTGTTNYGSLGGPDAYNRGLREIGDDNTVTENRIGYFAGKTGNKGIWATSLFMEDANGTYQNICTASDGTVTANNRTTATTKIANTNGFKVGSSIWYTNTTYNANTNINGSAVVYSSISIFDTRYSFNTTLTAGSLTAYKPLYLVGTIDSTDNLFYLDTVWWTQTPNDPDKVYVLVGGVFDSNTSYCRATLYEQNKWYRYNGSSLVEIVNEANMVNGHIVESDVPNNADFDNTTYTFASGTNSFTVTPSGGTAQTITVTPSITNNVTGSGTNGKVAKFTGANTIGDGYSVDTTVTSGSANLITSGAVYTAIDNLPEPMVFKGSLGTGGTITALPVNGTANIGDTYKVITAGTYASQAAKVGDTFICDSKTSSANTWTLIPSGDEPSGTVTSVKINATSPIAIDSNAAITTSGERTISHANSGVTAGTYRSVTVNATGHVTAGTNPTTLSGYGITDAKITSGTITLGSNTITPLTSASTLDATKLSGTIPISCYTDTKNTAGSTDTSSKIFLIGATSQAANPQTYSQDTAYVDTNGHLYSNSKQVINLSDSQALTNKTYNGYTLGAACAKAVVTSVDTSASLPTSNAVKTFVEGKGYVTTDTKNTAGSTDTSSKIYLIGATSQAANPQTYSDNEVYATSGVLTTKSVQVGGTAATMQYNSTTQAIEFVFT